MTVIGWVNGLVAIQETSFLSYWLGLLLSPAIGPVVGQLTLPYMAPFPGFSFIFFQNWQGFPFIFSEGGGMVPRGDSLDQGGNCAGNCIKKPPPNWWGCRGEELEKEGMVPHTGGRKV